MTKASFRFSPKILARLGEELNQTPDQSIVELVKNAYDADASRCVIELQGIAKPGGTIVVADDGDGMDAALIRDRWLVLGRSAKDTRELTRLGRLPAGSKGLGRLAALRMGTGVRLQSIERANSRRLHELQVDWSKFDGAEVVEDVELSIDTRKNTSGGHGTRTELLGLRTAVTSDEVRRLARSLLLLTDPFSDASNGFAIQLVAPEFKEIESLLRKKYFDDASFHLRAEIDAAGKARAKVLDWQGNELASTDLEAKGRSRLDLASCPPATFDLWIFLLGSDSDTFSSRRVSKAEVQAWLKAFGGVHVYQDGIRVAPYGNPGNDWLEMNLARARSPEERPSTNTSIGRVQIVGGENGLTQKTDRSGFIENEAFHALREFAQSALDWLAHWRLEAAEKRRARDRVEAPKAATAQRHKVEAAIASAPEGVRRLIENAFAGYDRTRDREADALRKEVQLYRTLSTAGITAATFSHESQGNPIKRIELSVNALKTRLPKLVKEADREKLLLPLEGIEKATIAIATLGTATLSLVKASKRRIEKVSVHQTITGLLSLMDPFLKGMTATVELELCAREPFLRTSQAAIESIIANLVSNSLAAFERAATAKRIIRISTQVHAHHVHVRVADSGPGIVEHSLSDIWLPGVTAKPEGTGLGLTIVRDTVRDIGGSVQAASPGALGGAEFLVMLPILGS